MKIINIPNIITFLRISLTPFIVNSIYINRLTLALIIFLIASISDFLDGYLARKLDQKSILGLYLDPLADKIFILSIFHTIILNYNIDNSLIINLFNFILLKEIILFLGAIFFGLYKKYISINPNFIGKLNTFIQILFILYLFISYSNQLVINKLILYIFIYTVFILSFIVLLSYSIRLIDKI
jgi:cardiolipin synthase